MEILSSCPFDGVQISRDVLALQPGGRLSFERPRIPCPTCGALVPALSARYIADETGRVSWQASPRTTDADRSQFLRFAIERAHDDLRAGDDAEAVICRLETTVTGFAPVLAAALRPFQESVVIDPRDRVAIIARSAAWAESQPGRMTVERLQARIMVIITTVLYGDPSELGRPDPGISGPSA